MGVEKKRGSLDSWRAFELRFAIAIRLHIAKSAKRTEKKTGENKPKDRKIREKDREERKQKITEENKRIKKKRKRIKFN